MRRSVIGYAAVAAYVMLLVTGVVAVQLGAPQGPQPGGSPVVSVPATIPQTAPDQPTQTAVAVKEVESPAAPQHATDQAIWSLMVALLIQYLKKAPWFGLLSDRSSARLKSFVGFMAALFTAAGIHLAISGSIFDGGGASITVTGVSVNAFKDLIWQWASQQAWYLGVIKPKEATLFVPKVDPKAPAGGTTLT